MSKWTPLDLPFFEDKHAALGETLKEWLVWYQAAEPELETLEMQAQCQRLLQSLADSQLLNFAVPVNAEAGALIDVRSICMIREALSYVSPLADFAFSMQGIGTAAIWMHGSPAQQARYLPACREGRRVAALALTELEGGSDVAATACRAERKGDTYVLNGAKAWISNGGLADQYIVIARSGDAPGAKGLSAFLVDADTPGLSTGPNIDLIAPHPISEVYFENCVVPAENMLGKSGDGFKVAMATLDIFRSSVGAAAVGLARRALDETLNRLHQRQLFGAAMADMDTVRMRVADMVVDVDTAALAVYRAGWLRDVRGQRITQQASVAKLVGTENAFRVIDSAVQLFGAAGITQGHILERLYRDIRPMRIYEGASEIQKLIIGRQALREAAQKIKPEG